MHFPLMKRGVRRKINDNLKPGDRNPAIIGCPAIGYSWLSYPCNRFVFEFVHVLSNAGQGKKTLKCSDLYVCLDVL